jgi:hypothetical protein
VPVRRPVLDGEIVSLGLDGRSQFHSLLFRRGEWPSFAAFDPLEVDGENLRDWPLLERKSGLCGGMRVRRPRSGDRYRLIWKRSAVSKRLAKCRSPNGTTVISARI